jgi:Zn-dependent protease with chaperone function
LNREQRQAVIAHEFSHILNGDMRLSIRLIGLIFGLMARGACRPSNE